MRNQVGQISISFLTSSVTHADTPDDLLIWEAGIPEDLVYWEKKGKAEMQSGSWL